MEINDILLLLFADPLKLGDGLKPDLLLFLDFFFTYFLLFFDALENLPVTSECRSFLSSALLLDLFKSSIVLLLPLVVGKLLHYFALLGHNFVLLPLEHLFLQTPVEILHDFLMHALLVSLNRLGGILVCDIDEAGKRNCCQKAIADHVAVTCAFLGCVD